MVHKLYYPVGEWAYEEPLRLSTEILVQDKDTFTGLYDAEGRELHRIKEPIGFIK